MVGRASIEHGVSAEGIQQIKMTERINAIFLIHPAALTLENIVQQTAHTFGMEGHPGFPVRPPAIEGNIKRTEYAVLIVKNNEFGMHIRFDFNQMMLGRTKNPHQLNSGAF